MWLWPILLLVVAVLFAGGFAAGWVRGGYLRAVAPAFVVALVLWFWLGGLREPHGDFTREALVLFVGVVLLIAFVVWALGAALGLVLSRRRSHPEDAELTLRDRRVQRR